MFKLNWHLSMFGQTTFPKIKRMYTFGDKNIKWQQEKQQHNNHNFECHIPCLPTTIFVVLWSSIHPMAVENVQKSCTNLDILKSQLLRCVPTYCLIVLDDKQQGRMGSSCSPLEWCWVLCLLLKHSKTKNTKTVRLSNTRTLKHCDIECDIHQCWFTQAWWAPFPRDKMANSDCKLHQQRLLWHFVVAVKTCPSQVCQIWVTPSHHNVTYKFSFWF